MAESTLNDAQRLVDERYFHEATALALIDIGRTLRDIRDELRQWETYGLNVRKHVK